MTASVDTKAPPLFAALLAQIAADPARFELPKTTQTNQMKGSKMTNSDERQAAKPTMNDAERKAKLAEWAARIGMEEGEEVTEETVGRRILNLSPEWAALVLAELKEDRRRAQARDGDR